MMMKDPGQRYQNPQEIVEALSPWTRQSIPPPLDTEMPRLSLAAMAMLRPRWPAMASNGSTAHRYNRNDSLAASVLAGGADLAASWSGRRQLTLDAAFGDTSRTPQHASPRPPAAPHVRSLCRARLRPRHRPHAPRHPP